MSTKRFEVEIKFDADGNVDVAETHAGFLPQLEQYRALTSCDVEKVNQVLAGLFATPGIVMNVPATLSLAMSKGGLWNGDPSTFTVLENRIHEVLSASDTLIITKGKGGGVRKANEKEIAYRSEHGEWPKSEKKSA